MNLPVTTKRATIILIEVKSYSAFSCMLLLCILINLKSVVRYNFFILDTCHPDDLYLCEQGLRTEAFFSKPRGFCKKNVWVALFQTIPVITVSLHILTCNSVF
jgi:hypothetical protein